jgi:hypothetical protein
MENTSDLQALLTETEKKLEDAEKKVVYHKREHAVLQEECKRFAASMSGHHEAAKKSIEKFELFLNSMDNNRRYGAREEGKHHLKDPRTPHGAVARRAKSRYEQNFPLPQGWSNLGKYTCNPTDPEYTAGPFKKVTDDDISGIHGIDIAAPEGWLFYSREPVEKTVEEIDSPGLWCLRADPAVRDKWIEDERLYKEQRKTDNKRARLM